MTDTEIKARLTERQVFALTIFGEARGEPIEGKVAVACVIRNRIGTRWPTAKDVCLAPDQFSCWSPKGGASNYGFLMRCGERLIANLPIDEPVWRECQWIADGMLSGAIRDRVGGNRYYVTTQLLTDDPPLWAQKRRHDVEIGRHTFFQV